jgi:host factor-I protein
MKTDTENSEQNRELKKDLSKTQSKVQKKESTKEKKNDIRERPSVIKNFIGKEIIITLRNGNDIKGRLETVVQYELVITVAQKPVIVMKHAIDYIELTGEK